jgi:hypothetical protein
MSIWADKVGMPDYSGMRPASGAWQDVGAARERTEGIYDSIRNAGGTKPFDWSGAIEEFGDTINPKEAEAANANDVDTLLETLAAATGTDATAAAQEGPGSEDVAANVLDAVSNRQEGLEEPWYSEWTPKDEGEGGYTDQSVGESAMRIGLDAAAAPEAAVLMGNAVQGVRRKFGDKTATSVTKMLADAAKNPALKKQIMKKIALRGAMAFTGPVGWAILAADLGYMGAKAASEAGWFGEGDPIGDFEGMVGGGLRSAADWMGFGGDTEINENKLQRAYGGRVGLQGGGTPWTQTMTPEYANQYYNQFSGPNYDWNSMVGATTGTEGTAGTGIENTAVGGSGGPKPLPQGGLAQQLGRGPEDRNFSAQGPHPEYGGFPGGHRPISYEDEDGILKADYVPANMQNRLQYGMMPGDEAPEIIQSAYDMYQVLPQTYDILKDTLGAFNPFTNWQQKKADEAQAIQDALQIQTAPNEQDDIIRNAFERQQLESNILAQDQLTADENQIFADQQLTNSLAAQQALDNRIAIDNLQAGLNPMQKVREKKQEGPKEQKGPGGGAFGGSFGREEQGGEGHHSGSHHF